ncbi:hypothetical protein PMAYCL1PPCAC_01319, partial [Pristionchus mayeri]
LCNNESSCTVELLDADALPDAQRLLLTEECDSGVSLLASGWEESGVVSLESGSQLGRNLLALGLPEEDDVCTERGEERVTALLYPRAHSGDIPGDQRPLLRRGCVHFLIRFSLRLLSTSLEDGRKFLSLRHFPDDKLANLENSNVVFRMETWHT